MRLLLQVLLIGPRRLIPCAMNIRRFAENLLAKEGLSDQMPYKCGQIWQERYLDCIMRLIFAATSAHLVSQIRLTAVSNVY